MITNMMRSTITAAQARAFAMPLIGRKGEASPGTLMMHPWAVFLSFNR